MERRMKRLCTSALCYKDAYPTDAFNSTIDNVSNDLELQLREHLRSMETTLTNMRGILESVQSYEGKVDVIMTVFDKIESCVTTNEVPEVNSSLLR